MPETKTDRNKSNKEVSNATNREKDKSRKVNNVKRNKKRSSSSASGSSTSSTTSSSSNSSSGSSSGSSSSSSSSSSNSSTSRSSSPSPKKVRADKKVINKKPEVKKPEIKDVRPENQSNKYKEKPKTQKPSDMPVPRDSRPNKEENKVKHEKTKSDYFKETEVSTGKTAEKLIDKVVEKPKSEEKIPKKSNKIHVTKLTRNITMAHLKEIFSTWGSVKHVEVPSDRFHPEFNRGFAYVEFDEPNSAQQAIVEMNNGQLDGQEISVVEVPVPRVEHEKDRPRRLSRDRVMDNRRFRSPPRRHVRSPVRQRSPPQRRSLPGRRNSPFRRRNVRSPPRRPRRESPRPRRRSRTPLSPNRRNGKERGDRKSPVPVRRRSKSSTSRSR